MATPHAPAREQAELPRALSNVPDFAVLPLLSGWKEIADYLGKGVRTVQRYERELSLPVFRPPGGQGARVFASQGDLDAWVGASPLRGTFDELRTGSSGLMVHDLRQSLLKMRRLWDATEVLLAGLCASGKKVESTLKLLSKESHSQESDDGSARSGLGSLTTRLSGVPERASASCAVEGGFARGAKRRIQRKQALARTSIFETYPPEIFRKFEEQQEKAREMKRTAEEMHLNAVVMSDNCRRGTRVIRVTPKVAEKL